MIFNRVLSRQELEDIKIDIAKTCNIPTGGIIVYDTGMFIIYNESEDNKDRIIHYLRNSNRYINISSQAAGYDFSHFNSFGQPKQKYNITGQILEDDINEI